MGNSDKENASYRFNITKRIGGNIETIVQELHDHSRWRLLIGGAVRTVYRI